MRERLARVVDTLAPVEADALLVSHLVNIRYLTGFTGSAGYLLLRRGDATLFVDGRYTEQAEVQFRDGLVRTTPGTTSPRCWGTSRRAGGSGSGSNRAGSRTRSGGASARRCRR